MPRLVDNRPNLKSAKSLPCRSARSAECMSWIWQKFACVLFLLTLFSMHGNATAQSWDVAEPGFKKKTALDISGVVCPGASLEWCYAVNDEKRYLQIFSIDDRTVVPGPTIRLLNKEEDGRDFGEPDAEAAAYSDGYVYVTGSHGVGRKSGEYQASRNFIFRFPVDSDTGAPAFSPSHDDVADEIERSSRLEEILKNHGFLGRFFSRALQENGINIEGLAVADGKAYVGMRQPVFGAGGGLLVAEIDCLFGDSVCKPVFLVLPFLERNSGIRDIAVYENSFLLLVGTAIGDEREAGSIWFWRGGHDAPEILTSFELSEGEKPEGLLIVPGKTPDGDIRAVVFFDGIKDGGPREIAVPSPQE